MVEIKRVDGWECPSCKRFHKDYTSAANCIENCTAGLETEPYEASKFTYNCEICKKKFLKEKEAVACEEKHIKSKDKYHQEYMNKQNKEKLLAAGNNKYQAKLIISILIILAIIPFAQAYYTGYDYGLNKTVIKTVIRMIPNESFINLTNIEFTKADCVSNIYKKTDDGFTSQCAIGIFKYWDNGRNKIKIANLSNDPERIYDVLKHELVHLDQWRHGIRNNFSEEEADNFTPQFNQTLYDHLLRNWS